MKWIRNLLLTNWRNKAIALFFALSIWFLAYQSETKELSSPVAVRFRPADAENTVILGALRDEEQQGLIAFDGRFRVDFAGQRKQIERLRDNLPSEQLVEIPAGALRYKLRPENFGFPRDGVSITSIDPSEVQLVKEPRVKIPFDLKNHVQTRQLLQNYEFRIESVTPESVLLRGPQSLVDRVSVKLPVDLSYRADPVDSRFKLEVSLEDAKDAAQFYRFVEIQNLEGAWVDLRTPIYVQVKAELKEPEEMFSPKDLMVRVMFRYPVTDAYLKFVIDYVPGDMIPVAFSGPTAQIDRLRRRINEPGFALTVRPPPNFDPREGGTYTFTEESLELYGFPGVSVVRHETRKTPFTYRVQVVAPDSAGGE